MDDETYMKLAVDVCRRGIEAGQSPFGACIVGAGEVLACEHNRVWLNADITAHAEIQALRCACSRTGSVILQGATIYSTTEPCPMCFSAIHWARIRRIAYGAAIEDARQFGFNELPISNRAMKEAGGSEIEIVPGILRDECMDLFAYWRRRGGKPY